MLRRGRKVQSALLDNIKNDLEPELGNEIIQFYEHLHHHCKNKHPGLLTSDIREVLKSTREVFPNVFPNVRVFLNVRVYLSFPCSVCEGERSLLKLLRIKNKTWATLSTEIPQPNVRRVRTCEEIELKWHYLEIRRRQSAHGPDSIGLYS